MWRVLQVLLAVTFRKALCRIVCVCVCWWDALQKWELELNHTHIARRYTHHKLLRQKEPSPVHSTSPHMTNPTATCIITGGFSSTRLVTVVAYDA
jgi:hypothetical protein